MVLPMLDMAGVPDNPDMPPRRVVLEAVWIGAGGSAATKSWQISLSAGGFDTPGPASTSDGGVQLTPGLFCSHAQ